jgi:hypothetical protein
MKLVGLDPDPARRYSVQEQVRIIYNLTLLSAISDFISS